MKNLEEKFTSSMRKNNQISSGNTQDIVCRKCGENFDSWMQLNLHLRSHHPRNLLRLKMWHKGETRGVILLPYEHLRGEQKTGLDTFIRDYC